MHTLEQEARVERKRRASKLLASETATVADFEALLEDPSRPFLKKGTLDASPRLAGETVLHQNACVKIITPHAAQALQSCGIKCLNLEFNPHLTAVPVKELCSVESLKELQCKGCSSFTTIPQEVAEKGGIVTMARLHIKCFEILLKDVAGPMEQGDYKTALDNFMSLLYCSWRADKHLRL
jgi:hypothetical protein